MYAEVFYSIRKAIRGIVNKAVEFAIIPSSASAENRNSKSYKVLVHVDDIKAQDVMLQIGRFSKKKSEYISFDIDNSLLIILDTLRGKGIDVSYDI